MTGKGVIIGRCQYMPTHADTRPIRPTIGRVARQVWNWAWPHPDAQRAQKASKLTTGRPIATVVGAMCETTSEARAKAPTKAPVLAQKDAPKGAT